MKVIEQRQDIEKWMMKIWRKIGLFEITEQNQTRVIRTNGWPSKVELDEIQRKNKEGENMEKSRIKHQNTYVKRSHEKVDVELMNSLTEDVLSGQQDRGLTDGLWLIEEQNRWKKMKLHLI